jgi:hypothetical protein
MLVQNKVTFHVFSFGGIFKVFGTGRTWPWPDTTDEVVALARIQQQ